MRGAAGRLVALALLAAAGAALAQGTLGSFMGSWTISANGDCSRNVYRWSLSGDLIQFLSPNGNADVERVIDMRPGGFTTTTVSSRSNAQGTRWDYRIIGSSHIQIRNLSTGREFPAFRCS